MRRWHKVALIALAVAVAPFCWSVSRDLLPLPFAGDKESIEEAKTAIAIQLVAEHERRHIGDLPPLYTSSIPPNCLSVAENAVRTNYRLTDMVIDGVAESDRSKSFMVQSSAIQLAGAFLADKRAAGELTKSRSSAGLAALNGCLKATPFGNWCDRIVEANIAAEWSQVEADLVIVGLMRHATDEYGSKIICHTIPSIEPANRER